VREMMEKLSARARVISGRCLPYGEGITFWPLRGMVVAAAGIHEDDTPDEARAKILDCVRDQDVADRLASATGLTTTVFPLHEINWGARKFLQTLAAESPVVALFDDIHWAEPAFLDLMDNLLDTIEDAPVLMLATARHDLIETRPNWGERERARRLVLQPLGNAAVAQVVTNLLGSAGLPETVVQRVTAAAEGNPLYIEQMLSMLIDSGVVRQEGGQWVAVGGDADVAIPPTIHALLEARLDSLDRGERAAAGPASVIGLEFARPAVHSLCPPQLRDSIDEKLQSLSRKRFIRSSVSTDDEAHYRFDHHLVRDTVYNGLLKRARATMHAQFVQWADQVNADSDRGREFEEILGYHLEQAYRYLAELGPVDASGAAIGRDGARRLGSAARRALGRGDTHAAAGLFKRATELLPRDDPQRCGLLPEFAEALMGLGKFAEARAMLQEAIIAAERMGDQRLQAASKVVVLFIGLFSRDAAMSSDEMLRSAQELIPVLEREQAHYELATAWRLVLSLHAISGRYRLAADASEKSLIYARLAGNDRLIARIGGNLAMSALYGPTTVVEAISQCERLIAEGLPDRQVESVVMCKLAQLRAMNGELDVARKLYTQGRAALRDLGRGVNAAQSAIDLLRVELNGGDLAAAEREAREDYEFLTEIGETYYMSTTAALLSRVVRDQGRDEEALEFSKAAEKAAAPDDIESQALWRSVRAPIVARQGQADQAEELAQMAVAMVRDSEALHLKAEALSELASVLRIVGKSDQARSAVKQAIELYRSKGCVFSSDRLSAWADGL
jgi:tetratricopeptide (TPR) repeat protein